jgi:DNA-binding NarL/FixJ family response regulator
MRGRARQPFARRRKNPFDRFERAMDQASKETARNLPATPWGILPPRMSVLYITAPGRTGAWLAESFAGDSACHVVLEEARGAAAGLARLRDQVFDAVLIGHEPTQLDAFELLDALRAGGAEEPLVVLGQPSEQELAAMCFEAGADAYVCANTGTTRTLLWIVARATERRNLIRENRRLAQAQRHRLRQEHGEAERLLTEQRSLARDWESLRDDESQADRIWQHDPPRDADLAAPPGDSLRNQYREVLRTHVIMGSGNLSSEIRAFVELLADSGVTAPQAMHLHVQVLEELVRGLGNRSSRHVMTRADLLVLEVLVNLAECYRLRSEHANGWRA